MRDAERADAVVVGAGPAGASAAYHLGGLGCRVLLLDKRRFPRDKSCGDGVTRPGVRLLDEMGVLSSLADAQRYDGLRMHVRDRGTRDFRSDSRDPDRRPEHGLVVPRLRLDELLVQAAANSGAEVFEECEALSLLSENGRVRGVRTVRGGREGELEASFVVCADGATSGLARKAGVVTTAREAMGYAIRGYYEGVADLPSMLEFYFPINDPADEFILPSYGWVFPIGSGAANIGVGLAFRAHNANIRRLQERFVEELRETDARFQSMSRCGSWRGAPLRSDFSPDQCVAPGVFVIGDAAGMVSPFTGEGISYALEAGKLAAQALHQSLVHGDDTPAGASGFPRTLARRYGGYFETGREAGQRYKLTFRVIASTFDDDRPVFSLCRRAVVMPEGVGGLRTSDVLDDIADLVEPIVARLRADLTAVDEVLVRSVQGDWPFLSRFAASVERDQIVPARAATLLLMSAYLGQPDGRDLIDMAAAIELSFFAALTHAGLAEDGPRPEGGSAALEGEPHWGNIFAILAGNFQLAKAFELAGPIGTDAVRLVTRSVIALCEGRAEEIGRITDLELTPEDYIAIVEGTTGAVFESICGLGGWLGQVNDRDGGALREYGRRLGVAYHLADELVSVAGKPTPMGPVAVSELSRRRMSLPVILALRGEGALARSLRDLLADRDPGRESIEAALANIATSGAMAQTLAEIKRQARAAENAAARLTRSDVRDALREVAKYPVNRAEAELPHRPPRTRAEHTTGETRGVWTLPEELGVGEEVELLRELLLGWRTDADPELAQLLEYQLAGHAKYFRPVTIFVCHRAAADPRPFDRVLRAAAAVELFHNYTLIVDDIVDRDRFRRGKLALHHRYGRSPSLATGGYLAFGATDLIADDESACRTFDELGKRIVVAECRQWRLRRQALGLDVWRSLAQEDTGTMFEACARVATVGNSLARFGYLVGTLYHGCDDVADVRGAVALGGGREKDISDRILTLPAAIAVRDVETARLFEEGGPEADDELAARFGACLPEAEKVLDDIASEAEAEASRSARTPKALLPLVHHTRALSTA